MSKRRPIQGQAREIIFFLISNFEDAVSADEELKAKLEDDLYEIGVSLIEFSPASGSLGVISESVIKATLDEIHDVLDKYKLKANYSRSEFV